MKHCIGFPVYGRSYKTKIFEHSLTSSDDIPNSDGSGVVVGNLLSFDSNLGVKCVPSTDQNDWAAERANQRIYYDGPYSSNPTKAWGPQDTTVGKDFGITLSCEIEKACFDATGQSTWIKTAAGSLAPMGIDGTGTSKGLYRFGLAGTSGNRTYQTTIGSDLVNANTSVAYLSKYANDKEYVPVVASIRKNRLDIYIDGFHVKAAAISAFTPDIMDDMYLVGRQYEDSGSPPPAPAGFPYYMRNIQLLAQPVILPVNPLYDRIAFIGDSNVLRGDYDTGSARYNSSHAGTHTDAGMTPMLERLMHRRGIFTSDIHNSGVSGARVKYVATGADLIDQVDGTNAGTVNDALAVGSHIGVIVAGLNDAIYETSTVADIKAAMKAVLIAMFSQGFEHIVLCNVFDAQGAVGATNSAAVIASRTADINTAYNELVAGYSNVYLCDLHTALGGTTQNADYFLSDLIHFKEEGHALVGREVYKTLAANVFKA